MCLIVSPQAGASVYAPVPGVSPHPPGEQLAAVVSRMTSRIGSTFTNRGVVDFQLDAAPYLIERARVTDER